MDTTLPGRAADLVTGAGETATEAIDKGRDRAREVMVTAEEHLPESAIDWTRGHVPGLTPRRRAVPPPRLIVAIALLVGIIALVWWLKRSNGDAGTQSTGSDEADHDRGAESGSAVAGR